MLWIKNALEYLRRLLHFIFSRPSTIPYFLSFKVDSAVSAWNIPLQFIKLTITWCFISVWFFLQTWELVVLSQLNWDINFITAFDFIDFILVRSSKANGAGKKYKQIIRRHAITFIALCATGKWVIRLLIQCLMSNLTVQIMPTIFKICNSFNFSRTSICWLETLARGSLCHLHCYEGNEAGGQGFGKWIGRNGICFWGATHVNCCIDWSSDLHRSCGCKAANGGFANCLQCWNQCYCSCEESLTELWLRGVNYCTRPCCCRRHFCLTPTHAASAHLWFRMIWCRRKLI